MKNFMKKLAIIIAIFSILYNIILIYVDAHIENRVPKDIFDDCHKIWSARGIYSSVDEQNSLTSLSKAIKEGYIGFEIDFYYDIKSDRFIISHDRPKKDKDGNLHYTLKNGTLLTLKEVFEKVGEGHYFWLDYKNLDRISKEDSLKSIKRLEKISNIYNMKDRIYIEGSTPYMLKYYNEAGFKTLIACRPLPENYIFHSFSSNIYKIVYYFSTSSALAIQYGKLENPKYSKTTRKNFANIPQFIFHVPPNKELTYNLSKSKDVRVLLVGRDISVNFAKQNRCDKR
jgi:hypothetical protein